MKTILLPLVILLMASCTTPKSSASSAADAKPADGVYPPGIAELTAIRQQYDDVTLDWIKAGYSIYKEGACTNCHQPKNIYMIDKAQWKSTLDNMAERAHLLDTQKDAVYKYVLSIKAVHDK